MTTSSRFSTLARDLPRRPAVRLRGVDLPKVFGFRAALEIVLVALQAKPAAIVWIDQNALEDCAQVCRSLGLNAMPSPVKSLAIPDRTKLNYVHSSISVNASDPSPGYVALFVSKDELLCYRLREADPSDRAETGRLLGYPDCCITFYCLQFPFQIQRGDDYILPAIDHLGFFPFTNNYAVRCFGNTLISHFPCSPACECTTALGTRNLEVLRCYNPSVAEYLCSHLRSAVIYTESEGVFYMPHYTFERGCLSFDSFFHSSTGVLYEALRTSGGKVFVSNHDEFQVAGRKYCSPDMGVLLFR
jgi:hypothetical protein